MDYTCKCDACTCRYSVEPNPTDKYSVRGIADRFPQDCPKRYLGNRWEAAEDSVEWRSGKTGESAMSRDEEIDRERKMSLRNLVDKIIFGSWTPGITDFVIREKITAIEKAEAKKLSSG